MLLPLQSLAQHALDALPVALVQLAVIEQVTLAVVVLFPHEVVQARFHAHQFAGSGLREPFDDSLASLDLIFAHWSLPLTICLVEAVMDRQWNFCTRNSKRDKKSGG